MLDPTVLAALIAVFGAMVAYWLGQRQAAVERKRRACAEAMADALKWLELPYRIRRRVDDKPATLSALAERASDLRERLEFHEKWLRVEIPTAHSHFKILLQAVRTAAGPAIEAAWSTHPAQAASQMNLGSLNLQLATVDAAVDAFSSEVTRELVWWRLVS